MIWNMGSPLDTRLTGIKFDQDDMPWWATAILGWLAMVKTMQESHEPAWRDSLKMHLEIYPPTIIYKLYDDYVNYLTAESYRAAQRR